MSTATAIHAESSSGAESGGIIPRLFGRAGDLSSEVKMLKFYMSTLEVRANALSAPDQVDVNRKALFDDVSTQIKNLSNNEINGENHDDMWNCAYKLDRELALVLPADTLVHEVQRRLDESIEEKVPCSPRLSKSFNSIIAEAYDRTKPIPILTSQGERNLRSLLQDILEEIQRVRQRKFSIRPVQQYATNRIVFAAILAFVLMLLPFFYLYGVVLFFDRTPVFRDWAWLPLYLVLTTGLFGAFF